MSRSGLFYRHPAGSAPNGLDSGLRRLSFAVLLLPALLAVLTLHAQEIDSIPLDRAGQWQVLSYSSIPSHSVSFSDVGVTIDVQSSASPIIYPLVPRPIDELRVSLEIEGDLNLKNTPQGDPGNDDFLFRIGLVYQGDKTLNFFQWLVAAGWVKTLFDVAPEGVGIARVDFYNVFSDPSLAGSKRVYDLAVPMSERYQLMAPARISKDEVRSPINLTIRPESDEPVLALWISSDGDDTASNFRVMIRDISLQ